MAEELKKKRTSIKRSVNREINSTKQLIAEDESPEALSGKATRLKGLFREFTDIQDQYTDLLTDDAEIEASDKYFAEVQTEYIRVLNDIKEVIKTNIAKPKIKTETNSDELTREELLGLVYMPKVELQAFDGNPLQYHQFINSFDQNVDRICKDGDMKLTRLLQYTSGEAKEAIRVCQLIGGDEGYEEAREMLENRFGNAHLVTERIIRNLKSGKPAKTPKEIQQLADDMRNAQLVLEKLKMSKEVDSQAVVLDIIGRLPRYIQIHWKKVALEKKKKDDTYPEFDKLVEFVVEMAQDVNDPVYGQMNFHKVDINQQRVAERKRSHFSATTSVNKNDMPKQEAGRPQNTNESGRGRYHKPEPPCILCSRNHRLWNCDAFREMSPSQRLDIVNNHKLCHNCLLASHEVKFCGKRSVCSVPGCGKKHTRFIHIEEPSSDQNVDSIVSAHTKCSDQNVYMPIVEVTVNNFLKVHALLDSASSNSFCSNHLVKRLGISGKTEEYTLNTLQGSQCKTSEYVSLSLSGSAGSTCNDETIVMSKVYVIDEIPVNNSVINLDRYSHLTDVPLSKQDNVKVDILIGLDNTEALVPLEIRKGGKGEPFAVKTLLGWYVSGRMPLDRPSKKIISHFISVQNIENDVSKLWTIENDGLDGYQESWSQEDKHVINLWDEECVLKDSHYILPIPWRDRSEPLPNNYVVARVCLESLLKKLKSNGLMDRYQAAIDKLLNKGYAEIVPDQEIDNAERIWYLPHHAVITEKKPDKLRVVYDCASKYQGMSLNDRCLQGPDLINKLLCVLIRFRQHQFAVQADIEAMYNQVKIPQKDKDALRFLWVKGERLIHLRMTSHLFGGVWCSSSSTYALRKTVYSDPSISPAIKKAILKSFYVDDYLVSVATKEETVFIIKETPAVLQQGGFHLTKFVVNDESILMEIPVDDQAKEVKEIGSQSTGKVLGIQWDISNDCFYFQINSESNNNKLNSEVTRRNMLSVVSSIYDPLGLINPLIITGKLLFQEATRFKLSWDEVVPHSLKYQWEDWVSSLRKVIELRFPRCLKPTEYDLGTVELHHFSDASQKAYGSCTYLRCVNKNGKILSRLILSKTKVAPIKQCTIPRLELQGAVLSVKLDAFLRREMSISIDQSYYWTDSEIVLRYIMNDTRRFNVFVGNRISVIRQLSNQHQ